MYLEVPQFCRLIDEFEWLLVTCIRLCAWAVRVSATSSLDFRGLGACFMFNAGPFKSLCMLDAVNVLQMEPQLLHQFECFATLRSWM